VFSSVMLGMALDLFLEVARYLAEHDRNEDRVAALAEWNSVPVDGGGPGALDSSDPQQLVLNPILPHSQSGGSLTGDVFEYSETVSQTGSEHSFGFKAQSCMSANDSSHNINPVGFVAGALRRGQAMFSERSRTFPASDANTDLAGGEGEALPEFDTEDLERHAEYLSRKSPDFVVMVLSKADEDAIWISSLGFSKEILFSVLLPRLQLKIFLQVGGINLMHASVRTTSSRSLLTPGGSHDFRSTSRAAAEQRSTYISIVGDDSNDCALAAVATAGKQFAPLPVLGQGDLELSDVNSCPSDIAPPPTNDLLPDDNEGQKCDEWEAF
jgi:hypothetical protein